MLRACARLLRPGGRTAFLTIHPAAGLGRRERRRAHREGPVAVATRRPHRELLEAAGFVEITEDDWSAEFATVTAAWIEQWGTHREAMEAMWGADVFVQRQRDRRAMLRATEDVVLRRSLFTARRPPAAGQR